MQCDKIRDHFSDYLIERLTPEDQAALAQHVRECAVCKDELEEWTDIWVKMGALTPEGVGEPVSTEASTRLRRAIKDYKQEWSLQTHEDRENGKLWRYAVVAAAAVLVMVGTFIILQQRSGPVAPGTIVDGSLNRTWGGQTDLLGGGDTVERGEGLRTELSGAVLELADGSRVEMRAQTELSLEGADDGVRIRLGTGGVIVNAAKQHSGHLYVQTKDVTVSVVGTVFLVNAEKEGSRVAVIEGEVRVQHGAELKKLLPGEQLSTSPEMKAYPVSEEIAWSRQAEMHVAMLEQVVVPPPVAAQKRLEFEVVSIKPRTDGLRGGNGFSCQGVDGIVSLEGPAQPTAVPRGRCVGQSGLQGLVSVAYGVPRRQVSGGPEWVQQPLQRFVVEAKALDPGSATAEQLRQMLQTLLSDRFKLKFHRGSQDLQQYVLRVAKNGLKLKPATGTAELPHMVPSGGLLGITIRGTSDLRKLADFLVAMVGFPVVDGTNETGTYEYLLKLNMVDGQRGGGNGLRGAGGGVETGIIVTQFDPPVSTALQEQLGLQLDLEKIPTDVIVIDQAERPEEN